ncbi:hypothetical protein SM0020_17732 [Sinorhizobium meliloti CCNWSX0020]|uniref:Uncharacterized protein n=1 Tax=Sinorhizobium meliloti CCNWSX0020 TaxID=1107881 RepID=H0G256_RHIML|nr:hypothetical protein SM0020_17732 [Sinorhizobium meliloti CCNWSX0020]
MSQCEISSQSRLSMPMSQFDKLKRIFQATNMRALMHVAKSAQRFGADDMHESDDLKCVA